MSRDAKGRKMTSMRLQLSGSGVVEQRLKSINRNARSASLGGIDEESNSDEDDGNTPKKKNSVLDATSRQKVQGHLQGWRNRERRVEEANRENAATVVQQLREKPGDIGILHTLANSLRKADWPEVRKFLENEHAVLSKIFAGSGPEGELGVSSQTRECCLLCVSEIMRHPKGMSSTLKVRVYMQGSASNFSLEPQVT